MWCINLKPFTGELIFCWCSRRSWQRDGSIEEGAGTSRPPGFLRWEIIDRREEPIHCRLTIIIILFCSIHNLLKKLLPKMEITTHHNIRRGKNLPAQCLKITTKCLIPQLWFRDNVDYSTCNVALKHTIRKVKFLSKNSILTKPQHFHEFFNQFFW